MSEPSEPNLRVPLVPSVNGENMRFGTSSFDTQINVNCVHDVVRNPHTSNATTYLMRRPGWNRQASSWGTSTKTPRLMCRRPSDGAASWMFAVDTGGAQVATDGSTNTTLFSGGGYAASFVTVCNVAGSATAIVQYRTGFDAAQRVFYGSTIASWTEIVDPVFTALSHRGKMEFLDGHLLILAGNRNIYNCKLNDPATWPAGNIIPKSIRLDIPSGLILHKNVVLAMGTESSEGFQTDGTNNPAGSILTRRKDLTFDIGLAPVCGNDEGGYAGIASNALGSYYAQVGGHTFFLGKEDSSIALYAFNGSSIERVDSSSFVNKILADNVVYSIERFCFRGHRGIAMPVTIDRGKWLYFDIDWKQWYLFTSSRFTPINDGVRFAGGNGYTNELYGPEKELWADGPSGAHVFDAYIQLEIPNEDNKRKKMAWCGLLGKTTTPLDIYGLVPQTSNVSVFFAEDDAYDTVGGQWVARGTIDMKSDTKRVYRRGVFRRRKVKLVHSNNVEWKVQEFQARIV